MHTFLPKQLQEVEEEENKKIVKSVEFSIRFEWGSCEVYCLNMYLRHVYFARKKSIVFGIYFWFNCCFGIYTWWCRLLKKIHRRRFTDGRSVRKYPA